MSSLKGKISSVSPEPAGQVRLLVVEYSAALSTTAWTWPSHSPGGGPGSSCVSLPGREALAPGRSHPSREQRPWPCPQWHAASPACTTSSLTATKALEASVSTCVHCGKKYCEIPVVIIRISVYCAEYRVRTRWSIILGLNVNNI